MAAGNLTPRQKMIGMMYLVLTALLALNVSKDILDAFVILNNGLERTRENLSVRTQQQYSEFDLAKSVDPKRIMDAWIKAQQAKKLSEELVLYIEGVKKHLVSESESIDKKIADTLKLANVEKKDEYDIPTYIMVGELEDGSRGVAREIKNKLNHFKNQLMGFIFPEDRKKIDLGIHTSDPPNNENNENWEINNFHHTPLAACITILSKMQNDTKNAETIILDYLLKKADVEVLKFDTIAPKIIPQSNYVLLGEEYKADVFIAAFNKTQDPVVMAGNMVPGAMQFNGDPAQLLVEKGIGKYSYKTNREGFVQWGGTISMRTPRGKTITYPFNSEFIVAKPSLTVSADKMNVFYRGVENPVSISVPGVPNERVKVSITNGSIRRVGDGKYIVMAGASGRLAEVSVTATMENGETREMGKSSFRVKSLPTPYAVCGSIIGSGKLKKNILKTYQGLRGEYETNFEFQIRCQITSFNVYVKIQNMIQGPYSSNKNEFTSEMKTIFGQLKKGDKVYIEKITALDQSNETKPLSPITIDIE